MPMEAWICREKMKKTEKVNKWANINKYSLDTNSIYSFDEFNLM